MVQGNFQCRGVLLFWITRGQVPTVLAVDAGGVVSLDYHLFFSIFLILNRLKYRLKGSLTKQQH